MGTGMLIVTTVEASPAAGEEQLAAAVAHLAAVHELILVVPSGPNADRAHPAGPLARAVRRRLPRWGVATVWAGDDLARDRATLTVIADVVAQGWLPVVAAEGAGPCAALAIAAHLHADAQCCLAADAVGRVDTRYTNRPPTGWAPPSAPEAPPRRLVPA
jgi:hypothetical protein